MAARRDTGAWAQPSRGLACAAMCLGPAGGASTDVGPADAPAAGIASGDGSSSQDLNRAGDVSAERQASDVNATDRAETRVSDSSPPGFDAASDLAADQVGTGGTTGTGDAGDVDAPVATGGVGGTDAPIATGGATVTDGPTATDARDAPVATGGTGAGGTGGASGSGGTTGTGGTTNAGGTTAVGGTTSTGGVGTGGGATGGTSTGGTSTGGTTAACQGSATQCSGNSVQTCTNGQWGAAVACGVRQTCTGPVGTAKCTCNVDPVCSSVGGTCANASTLATCSQDAQACFYQSSAMTCANGACSGAAGAASCCTNACTVGATCLSGTSLQTCAVAANGCTAYSTATCTNGACTGAAGAASCCTNACVAGATQCQSSSSLQTCAVAANGCTAYTTTATCSTGLVCERYAPAACVDPNWAEWPMPNSQADVTAGAPNLASYTDNGDGTVTDNVTGLMWQQAVPTTTYTWANAVAFCPTLTLAGHSDWRLPSGIELVSIVDMGNSSPHINGTYFPPTPANYFWSSSPLAGSSSDAWLVDFNFGRLATSYVVSTMYIVRCVR